MPSNKVFGIGFHKTATSSLAAALEVLGYRVTGPNGVHEPDIGERMWHMAETLIPAYDAFQDNPWPLLYEQVDRHVPEAKFILTLRDPERWIRSVVGHFGRKSTPMREVIYGQGKGSPVGNESLYVERYLAHNEVVMQYFAGRPDDLLVMDITDGDGWERLCPFLGISLPDKDFPHSNSSDDRPLFRRLLSLIPRSS